jgi:hypothetical protein
MQAVTQNYETKYIPLLLFLLFLLLKRFSLLAAKFKWEQWEYTLSLKPNWTVVESEPPCFELFGELISLT